jgi:hypothetical protein
MTVPFGECDPHGRAGKHGVRLEQVTPQPVILGACDLASPAVDEGHDAISGQGGVAGMEPGWSTAR